MSRSHRYQAAAGLTGYLCLVLLPVLLLAGSALPVKGGFWWNAGIAWGFSALVMLVLQFFLTARLRVLSAPYGIDVIYAFHRYFAWVLCAVVLLHPLILLWLDPSLWPRLSHDWTLQSGTLAFALIAALMVSSVWRKRMRLAYHHWRRLHAVLALAAVAFALAHLHAVNYYSAAPALRWLCWGLAIAMVLLVMHLHLLRPWQLLRRPWVVTDVRAEQGSCHTLTLQPQGHAGLRFEPGQFAWLSLGHTPFSLQEHPFSLACAPQPEGGVQFTIKALGDFSSTIGAVTRGTLAYVDGPYGIFSCDRYPAAPGYVFIGGGIGIAPLFAMLQALAARGDTRPHMLFAAHSRYDRIPRRDELVALAHRLNLVTVPVLEEPPPGWQGERGWFTPELLARHLDSTHQHHEYFVCGPRAMTDLVEHCLRERGIPAAHIHTELFSMA